MCFRVDFFYAALVTVPPLLYLFPSISRPHSIYRLRTINFLSTTSTKAASTTAAAFFLCNDWWQHRHAHCATSRHTSLIYSSRNAFPAWATPPNSSVLRPSSSSRSPCGGTRHHYPCMDAAAAAAKIVFLAFYVAQTAYARVAI